jgi:hypothetical protein
MFTAIELVEKINTDIKELSEVETNEVIEILTNSVSDESDIVSVFDISLEDRADLCFMLEISIDELENYLLNENINTYEIRKGILSKFKSLESGQFSFIMLMSFPNDKNEMIEGSVLCASWDKKKKTLEFYPDASDVLNEIPLHDITKSIDLLTIRRQLINETAEIHRNNA